MKRKLAIAATVIGLLSAIVYFVPIFVSSAKAQPLYGNFDRGMKCMGGHEIFLFLEQDKAFGHCPGHRDMILIGPVERSANSVTIYRKHVPWYRVDLDGSDHTLVYLNDPSTQELPQVNNPWRTWLPRLLPEE